MDFNDWMRTHHPDVDVSRLADNQRVAWQTAWRSAIKTDTDGTLMALSEEEQRAADLAALRASRTRGPVGLPRQSLRGGESVAIEAGLMQALGVSESAVERLHDEQTMQHARDCGYHRLGLHDLFRIQLRAAGRHVPHGKLGESDCRDAMRIDAGRFDGDAWQSGPSTISVSGILSNTAHKSALATFTGTPTTWQIFSKRMPVANFKEHRSYRLTDSLEFEQVAPDGAIKSGTLSEETAVVTAKTYGKLIALTRTAIVNDDLSIFATIPSALGRAGAIGVDKAVYSLVLSNPNNFFQVAFGNDIADTALAVLNIAGLSAAEAAFLGLLDPNGRPAFISPALLLTGPALAVDARRLVADAPIIDGTATGAQPAASGFAGRFTPIVSPWLAPAAGLAGAVATQWYLLAAAGDFAIVVVGFLDGKETPTIEFSDWEFDRLGGSWRGFFDYGVSMLERRGGYRSNGEAA